MTFPDLGARKTLLPPGPGPAAPLFFMEESADYYLVALDIPGLPAVDIQIKEKNLSLYVEGRENPGEPRRRTYLEFHGGGKHCRSVYRDGILWLIMPKFLREGSFEVRHRLLK